MEQRTDLLIEEIEKRLRFLDVLNAHGAKDEANKEAKKQIGEVSDALEALKKVTRPEK